MGAMGKTSVPSAIQEEGLFKDTVTPELPAGK